MKRTAAEKKALEDQRRLAQVPKARSYTVRLPKGTYEVKADFTQNSVTFTTGLTGSSPVACKFTFGVAVVTRKVRMYGQVVRDTNGDPVEVQVKLPATYATLTLGKEEFNARSVCKPPDKFDRRMGMKLALRHLLKLNSIHKMFSQEDYEILVKVCLTKPPKPGQIARAQRLAKVNAEAKPKKEAAK